MLCALVFRQDGAFVHVMVCTFSGDQKRNSAWRHAMRCLGREGNASFVLITLPLQ